MLNHTCNDDIFTVCLHCENGELEKGSGTWYPIYTDVYNHDISIGLYLYVDNLDCIDSRNKQVSDVGLFTFVV